jgi:hypothetical protein
LLLLFALAALAPTTAMASEWYRCRTMGVVQQTCCCPKKSQAKEQPASDQPQAKAAGCCDVELSEARASDPRSSAPASGFLPVPPSAVERVAFATHGGAELAIDLAVTPRQSQGPPALYLRHCSLLL